MCNNVKLVCLAGLLFPSLGWCFSLQDDVRDGVMEYEAQKLKELSAYLGEKNWFAGETVQS